jgi:acetyl esterase/lipase
VTRARIALALAGLLALAVGCSSTTGSSAGTGTTLGTAPGTTVGTEPAVACGTTRTVGYATYPGVDPNLTSLDVTTPAAVDGSCADRPMVVWVHGGGWTSGDKAEAVDDKRRLFTDAGFVFATVNYRLTDKTAVPPAPQHPVHDQDTADALAWLFDHAAELGVDRTRVAVLGHSAGGGIVAAVATDPTYLGAHGYGLTDLTCAGSMDGEGYDITAGATTAPTPEVQQGYRNAFGDDPAVWAAASPIDHVVAGAGIPSFFVAARGTDWRLAQHLAFIDALQQAGVPTTVLDSRTLEHADLATDVGAPGDTVVTPPLMDFLTRCFA